MSARTHVDAVKTAMPGEILGAPFGAGHARPPDDHPAAQHGRVTTPTG